jgi:hypothetical protein
LTSVRSPSGGAGFARGGATDAGACGHKYGGHCPQREPARAETSETTSRAGRQIVGLPSEVVELLKAHREAQERERHNAGQLWNDGDSAMATRCQHVTGAIQRDIADRVGGLIWQVEDPSREGN